MKCREGLVGSKRRRSACDHVRRGMPAPGATALVAPPVLSCTALVDDTCSSGRRLLLRCRHFLYLRQPPLGRAHCATCTPLLPLPLPPPVAASAAPSIPRRKCVQCAPAILLHFFATDRSPAFRRQLCPLRSGGRADPARKLSSKLKSRSKHISKVLRLALQGRDTNIEPAFIRVLPRLALGHPCRLGSGKSAPRGATEACARAGSAWAVPPPGRRSGKRWPLLSCHARPACPVPHPLLLQGLLV